MIPVGNSIVETPFQHQTRVAILGAARRLFARSGYAATSVKDIVDAAQVSKPTLYYYFPDKAGLYQALVDQAHDERYRLICEAAQRVAGLENQLVEILTALLEFQREHRDLMRIAFATAFAAPGELPESLQYLPKCQRNFDFLHDLIREGLAAGEMDNSFNSEELTLGLYGQLNIYVMADLILPKCDLNRETAQRIVRLFLSGAASKS